MFKEYQVVKATKDITSNVKEGCVGTIVYIHQYPNEAYEVEFVDENNDTIDSLSVNAKDIKILKETTYEELMGDNNEVD